MGDLIQYVKILLVEDDQATCDLLENNFTLQGYKVDVAVDGRSALDLVRGIDYDLVVLDVEIPKLDGISVCKQLRTQGYQMPVLLLTAHDLTSDRVIGLDAGADDYMIKPFNLLELLARIRALLRRGSTNTQDLINWGKLQLNRPLQEIRYGENLLRLTPKEYGILELLLLNPHRILSRAAFLDRLWQLEEPPTESAISSHIKALRQKLKTAGAAPNLIETMYGFGYRLRSLELQPSNVPKLKLLRLPNLSKLPPNPEAEATTAMMQGLWERFKDSFQEQLTFLERVHTAFQSGEVSLELQQEAKQTVHKLVGSLGLFGFPQGSTLARKMEELLGAEIPLQGAGIQEMAALTIALQQELKQEPVFNFSESKVAEEIPDDKIDEVISQTNQQTFLVLIVDDDQFLTESLQIEAHRRFFQKEAILRFRVEVAPNPRAAQLAIARCQTNSQNLPDILLLDLTFPEGEEDGWQWLAKLKQQHPQIPVLVFTGRDSLSDRIMAVRLGAQAFLQKPITHQEIFQIIQSTLQSTLQATLKQNQPLQPPIAGQVMAVDDDPMILHQLSVLLSAWGLQVKPLLEPSRFWEVLTETTPDLLILDVEMPGFSGIELCQVVRNDPQWEQLPILFLTAHQEPELMIQAFAVGGNDYIRKPIINLELIARVLHLLEPRQARQQLMMTLMKQADTK